MGQSYCPYLELRVCLIVRADRFQQMANCKDTYFIIVIVQKDSGQVSGDSYRHPHVGKLMRLDRWLRDTPA